MQLCRLETLFLSWLSINTCMAICESRVQVMTSSTTQEDIESLESTCHGIM